MKRSICILICVNAFFFTFSQPQVIFQSVITGLSSPVDLVNASDGSQRLFIVEQSGKIKIWNGSSVLSQPFLDMSTVITYDGGERGLLSMAFHPNYSVNGFFFLYYDDLNGNITVSRYKTKIASPNEADLASGVVLLSIPKPFSNHNGGKLNFGADGYLYFGTGDGGSGGDPFGNSQNKKSWLGKLLRIDVNTGNTPPYYSIPASNPFKNNPDVLNEVIATGLRNPWRWSFDRQTGDMWIADVGQNLWEEVNMRPKDSILNINYGWNCLEATHTYNTACNAQSNNIFPIFEYPHDVTNGGYSITGGYVYRGTEYPSLQGYYLCADYISGNGWLINPKSSGGWNFLLTKNWPVGISTFGESETGSLFAASLSGTVYKITSPATSSITKLTAFYISNKGQVHELNWQVENQEKDDTYVIERSIGNNTSFSEIGRVIGDAQAASKTFIFKATVSTNADYYYRIKIFTASGSNYYSATIKVAANTTEGIKAWLTDHIIQVFATDNIKSIILYDPSGRVLFRKKVTDQRTADFIPVISFAKGVIFCLVETASGNSRLFKFIN